MSRLLINKNKFLTFGILICLVVLFVAIPNIASAKSNCAPYTNPVTGVVKTITSPFGATLCALEAIVKSLGYALMSISGILLYLAGNLLDEVVKFTVLKMAEKIGSSAGVGGSINTAWATLRDVANICFIFVLLYAAFKAMFDDSGFGNFGTTVRNIIIVALLINFSLFFSKVVIDASNIVAIGFYKSIASANNYTFTTVNADGTTTAEFGGISGGYMRLLGLQSWYSPNIFTQNDMDISQILTVGIMSSIFMVVTSVIFLITAIMFLARFIILIFIMILSPLALIAYIIPGMKNRFEEWKDALINQSFFAPIFFALTWVAFKIGSSPGILGTLEKGDWTSIIAGVPKTAGNAPTATALILNYVMVIGFSIAALVFAKQMASKTFGFKAIAGGIGTGVLGGAGFLGRQTIGRYANKTLNDTDLRKRAAEGDIGARMTLASAKKLAGSSFDFRGLADTKLGKATGAGNIMDIAGKTRGVGGFEKAVKDKADARAKYAKDVYGQTDEEKEKYEEEKGKEKEGILDKRKEALEKAEEEWAKAEKERKDNLKEKTKKEREAYEKTKREKAEKETKLGPETNEEQKKKELQEITDRMINERAVLDEKKKDIEENDEEYDKLKTSATEKKATRDQAKNKKDQKDISDDEYSPELQSKIKSGGNRMRGYASIIEKGPLGIGWIGKMQGNKAMARAIRKASGEKSKAEKFADAANEYQKSLTGAAGTAPPLGSAEIPATPVATNTKT